MSKLACREIAGRSNSVIVCSGFKRVTTKQLQREAIKQMMNYHVYKLPAHDLPLDVVMKNPSNQTGDKVPADMACAIPAKLA